MALPLLSRKYVLLAKIQPTEGVDPVPTAGDNAILVENLKFKPNPEVLERKNIVLPDLSKIPHLIGKLFGELSFDVEWRGSSNSDGDVPPDFGPLLRACSMSETIVAGPGGSVTYAPESDNQELIAIYCYLDGQLQKFLGCAGDWKLGGQYAHPSKFSFTFKGIWGGASDAALVVPTYQNLHPPLCKSAAFSYGGWSPPVSKFEISLKNEVAEREDIQAEHGIKGFFVVDRNPEGSLDPEAALLATRNIWDNLINVNEAALSIVYGNSPGNQVGISCPKCVKKTVDWADRGGKATYDKKFGIYRTSGNDEISLAFT